MSKNQKLGFITPMSWHVEPAGYQLRSGCGNQVEIKQPVNQDDWFFGYPPDDVVHTIIPSTTTCSFGNLWLVQNDDASGHDQAPTTGLDFLEVDYYNPLKVAGLHRTFAMVQRPDDVVRFANKFGFLTFGPPVVDFNDGSNPARSELVSEWIRAAIEIRTLIRLWDGYRDTAKGHQQITEVIVFSNRAFTFREEMLSLGDFQYSGLLRDYYYSGQVQPEQSAYRTAARRMLERIVAQQLGKGTEPYVHMGTVGQLLLEPQSLLAAMYLLLTQELLGRADPLSRCPSCGKWFICRHASKIYCSDACKMKAYRQNKKGEAK